MENTRVSVIIPAYDAEASIRAAVDSALGQTYPPSEVIVVNDGSTDATAKLLGGYRGRIRVINQPNQGPSVARNAGARMATGEYLAFLDADDQWNREFLERMVAALERRKEAVLAVSDIVVVDCKGHPMGAVAIGIDKALPSSILMRRETFERCGGYCEQFRRPGGEDAYFYVLAKRLGPIEHVSENLVLYRTMPAADLADKYAEGWRISRRLYKTLGPDGRRVARVSDRYFASLLIAKSSRCLDNHDIWMAFRTFVSAIFAAPAHVCLTTWSRLFRLSSIRRSLRALRNR